MRKVWFLFIIIKLMYMVIAIGVVSKMTTLGDTFDYFYLNKPQIGTFPYLLLNSTYIMNLFGHNLYLIFGEHLANIPFIFLSTYGIYYPISKMKITKKYLIYILILLSFPSFGLWTSICSKESVGVFFMGIILGYIIDLIEKRRIKPTFIEIISFYLLLIFKTQYAPAVFAIILFIIFTNRYSLKARGKSILFFLFVISFILVLYALKDYANTLQYIMPQHFSMKSASTRENTMWINDYDIYFYAPKGMLLAFYGPTLQEALKKSIQMFSFLESGLILFLFLSFLLVSFLKIIKKGKINIYLFSLGFFAILWILFGHYPFGIFNPGSAVRYRENFYAFLVIFIFYLYQKSKEKYINRSRF